MRRDPQAGSVAVEMAIIAPGLLLLLALLIFGGRNALATGAVEQAAVDAARAASLTRSAADAESAARAAATRSMVDQGLACSTITVDVDSSGFGAPVGQAAHVSTSVVCTLRLSDLGLPGLPGSKSVEASAVSVLDMYRERQ